MVAKISNYRLRSRVWQVLLLACLVCLVIPTDIDCNAHSFVSCLHAQELSSAQSEAKNPADGYRFGLGISASQSYQSQ